MMRLVWTCMFTPRLYKIYRDGPIEELYQPQVLERWADKVISTSNILFNIGLYTSPCVCLYILSRNFFSPSEAKFLMQCFGGLSCLLMLCFAMRGVGRALNPKYIDFVNVLTKSTIDNQTYLNGIRNYDFEAKAWPVTHSVALRAPGPWFDNPFNRCANPDLPSYKRVPIQILAYLAAHTFGIWLVYPGSLSLVHYVLWRPVIQGRTTLVEDYGGKRARIGTADSNIIDTMFLDKRPGVKGKTLVVCCEGNSAYYEIGLLTIPAKAGYSVLGWNHPGFAGSTGKPYPEQERNAVDAVMHYAINELGFLPENIVMYGWSIGGYSAAYAGANYPLRGLILDATFDDLLPLAENQMPDSWTLLVKEVIRSYINLNVGDLLAMFSGPVQVVRRIEDEIICLKPGSLKTNCGNELVVHLIESRHPMLDAATSTHLRRLIALNDAQRTVINATATEEHEKEALNLISKYMRDFKATHCAPLSEQQFEAIMELLLRPRH